MTLLPTIASWTCVAVLFMAAQGLADDGRDKRDTMLKITTIEEPPYVTVKNKPPQSNADYEGYIPDLLSKIATKLNRKYTIHLVGDNHYGTKSDQGTWNGMIKEVMHDDADIAGAAMTITDPRKTAVDFTKPLMSFGISILMLKPKEGTSTIKSLKDLADQTEIKYGAIDQGSTMAMFKNSQDATYKKIYNEMDKDHTLLVNSVKEGVEKLRTSGGKYAIILESHTADYWMNKSPCDLVAIKNLGTPTKEYALAVKKGSSLREQLDNIITELKDKKELDELQKKWWKSECSGAKAHFASALSVAIAVLAAGLLYKN